DVFFDFGVRRAEFESLGKLDKIIKNGTDKYTNIFIDEAHRFRTESNITYEKLAQICRGKRVILVTATPLNNTPSDILSQLKLFQKSRKSTIPGLPNLDMFFSTLEKRLKNLDRLKDRDKFIKISKENSILIREKILKFLMVRRTRTEIQKYFKNDLNEQGLKFPEVADPQSLFYQLNTEEDNVFSMTIKLITKDFKYVRYTPLLQKYFSGTITQPEELAQKNMRKFMKILLVKRLESSFYAFNNSIDRFIISYEKFIKEFDKGNVYVSKKYSNKIFELIDNDDDRAIQRLIEEEKVTWFDAKEFKKVFKDDLIQDLNVLKEVKKIWSKVKRDPKIIKFIDVLKTDPILKNKKIIIFTESKETAEYLESKIQAHFPNQVLLYTGQSSSKIREKVTDNFDAKARLPKDDFRILVSTEVLSEGVNLHRSNIVINYDIPWNPTRLMQRVGRINRVDTKFDTIYSYNFFPTIQSNDQIKLTEAAVAKIAAFISFLGNDARLITDGEVIESHELFNRLTSKKTITGEDEKEISILEYINEIKNIRNKNPDLFAKVKKLPIKARSSRYNSKESGSLLTYFRKGKLQKFFLANTKESTELDFFTAAELLRADIETKLTKLSKDYYSLLDMNKKLFEFSTIEDPLNENGKGKGGRDSTTQFLKILRAMNDYRQFTEDHELYLRKVIKHTEEGGLPKQTIKVALKELKAEINNGIRPLKFLAVLQKNIPDELLKKHIAETSVSTSGPREVILSEFFTGE
ncbi:MAG: helicase, partial [Armatimonadetes bacterium]|nr:helicase [Armatimonadota bacterium]